MSRPCSAGEQREWPSAGDVKTSHVSAGAPGVVVFGSELTMYEDVGVQGAFASVHRAQAADGRELAVKHFRTGGAESWRDALREAACLLRAQRHPNVVAFHGLLGRLDTAKAPALVLDYVPGGDLFNYDAAHGTCTEQLARFRLSGVLSALGHIHKLGLIHRDVKPENVVLAADGNAILTDFGSTALSTDAEQLSLRVGSLGYTAPEVLLGKEYGCPVDVFGAGCILYFMLMGMSPFDGDDRKTIVWKTCQCRPNLESAPWSKLSDSCRQLTRHLLRRNPTERLSAVAALQIFSSDVQARSNIQTTAKSRFLDVLQLISAQFGPCFGPELTSKLASGLLF